MALRDGKIWALIGLSLGFWACSASSEDDDANTGGAGAAGAAGAGGAGGAGGASCTALSPTGTADLLISEIVPGVGIEVFNPGTTAVPLADIWFCSQFDYKQAPSASGKTEVPPGGYVSLSWPSANYGLATAASGEMLLFLTNDGFPSEENILDYVCWGDFAEEDGRKSDPIGGATLFPGPCAPALTAGSIHRKPATGGTDAASYDTAAAPDLADCPL